MTDVRYWVFVDDGLWDDDPQWPDGLRPIEPAKDGPRWNGCRWWLFKDDGAPASLNGKRVELEFVHTGNKVMIGSRSLSA